MDLPDVLDHLGKTPREFGGLHVHFESVARVDRDRVIARLLFQAAFDPLPAGAQVAFHAAADGELLGEQLACHDAPTLEDGRVCRVSYPLRLPKGATHVVAFIDAPHPSRAARVRPVWKLLDTIESPKLSELALLRIQPGLSTGPGRGKGMLEPGKWNTTLHKAKELPPWLAQEVSSEVAKPIAGPVEETLWSIGRPLPAPPPLVIGGAPPPARATRECRHCSFEGPTAEYERARECPMCGEPWT